MWNGYWGGQLGNGKSAEVRHAPRSQVSLVGAPAVFRVAAQVPTAIPERPFFVAGGAAAAAAVAGGGPVPRHQVRAAVGIGAARRRRCACGSRP
jgi:hypothetical protein